MTVLVYPVQCCKGGYGWRGARRIEVKEREDKKERRGGGKVVLWRRRDR